MNEETKKSLKKALGLMKESKLLLDMSLENEESYFDCVSHELSSGLASKIQYFLRCLESSVEEVDKDIEYLSLVVEYFSLL